MEVIIGGKSLGDTASQAGDLLLPAHPHGAGGWEAKGLLNILFELQCCPQLQSGSAGQLSHMASWAWPELGREVVEATIGRLHAVSTLPRLKASIQLLNPHALDDGHCQCKEKQHAGKLLSEDHSHCHQAPHQFKQHVHLAGYLVLLHLPKGCHPS